MSMSLILSNAALILPEDDDDTFDTSRCKETCWVTVRAVGWILILLVCISGMMELKFFYKCHRCQVQQRSQQIFLNADTFNQCIFDTASDQLYCTSSILPDPLPLFTLTPGVIHVEDNPSECSKTPYLAKEFETMNKVLEEMEEVWGDLIGANVHCSHQVYPSVIGKTLTRLEEMRTLNPKEGLNWISIVNTYPIYTLKSESDDNPDMLTRRGYFFALKSFRKSFFEALDRALIDEEQVDNKMIKKVS